MQLGSVDWLQLVKRHVQCLTNWTTALVAFPITHSRLCTKTTKPNWFCLLKPGYGPVAVYRVWDREGELWCSSVACDRVGRQFSLRIWTFGIAHMAFCAVLRIRPIVHCIQLSCWSVCVRVCVCDSALFEHQALMYACKHNQYLQIEVQTATATAAGPSRFCNRNHQWDSIYW